jgi:hypothetical protein
MFLDIETLPADESMYKELETIYKSRKKKNRDGVKKTFEEYLESTGLDGTWGRIFCLSYAMNDDPVECLSGDEKKILKDFWKIALQADMYIGFNVLDFDLKFIIQRSIIHQIRPSVDIPFARYRDFPVYDIMWEWTKWQSRISMDELARAMKLKSSKKDLDGSKVHQYYQKGKYKEIEKYCNADVELTRKIFKRMRFEG